MEYQEFLDLIQEAATFLGYTSLKEEQYTVLKNKFVASSQEICFSVSTNWFWEMMIILCLFASGV